MPASPFRPRRILRGIGIVSPVILAAIVILLWTAGMFDRDAEHVFPAQGRRAPVAALLFSGDMGLRYGMGPATSQMLAAHGVEVVGFNSSTLFRTRRTLAETRRIVARAVARTLASTGQTRLVLIGQSYGADILQTGLAMLPPPLRAHVVAVILVVPGETVFLRADPSGLVYRGTPDSIGTTTADMLRWTRLTCIYGLAETDSLCPRLRVPGARILGLPGGHFLNRDAALLGRHVLAAVDAAMRGR